MTAPRARAIPRGSLEAPPRGPRAARERGGRPWRWLALASLGVAAQLAGGSVAAGQDCMCLVPGRVVHTQWLDEADGSAEDAASGTSVRGASEAGSEAGRLAPGLFEDWSVEVGPMFSSDGESLVSADAALEAAVRRFVRTRLAEPVEPVLWCVSADDPRCSPRDEAPGPVPHDLDVTRGAPAARGPVDLAATPPRAAAPLRAGGSPRAGIRWRLERPPRA